MTLIEFRNIVRSMVGRGTPFVCAQWTGWDLDRGHFVSWLLEVGSLDVVVAGAKTPEACLEALEQALEESK